MPRTAKVKAEPVSKQLNLKQLAQSQFPRLLLEWDGSEPNSAEVSACCVAGMAAYGKRL